MSVQITFHGHATFSLDVNGTKLVVDPFFAGNSPVAKRNVDQVEAHYILLTHGHVDHIADAIPLAQSTGAQVIANWEIAGWLGGKGVSNVHAQHIGGGYNHPFGRVKMTIAFHGSGASTRARLMTSVCSTGQPMVQYLNSSMAQYR